MDFYSGSLSALNKVKELGLDISLKVIDTQNNFKSIDLIISSNSFDDYDFILGPLVPRNINQISKSRISQNHKIYCG